MSKVEVVLVNSYAPRQRVVSDVALENSLAIIRTHLEKKGMGTIVIDDQRIDAVEKGVPGWCLHLLRVVARLQLHLYTNKTLSRLLLLAGWPLQNYAVLKRKQFMQQRIKDIVTLIKAESVPVLGIKLWYGEAFQWSVRLAEAVQRECPETIIVAGGPQVKVYGDLVLENNAFDIAIVGPAEDVFSKLVMLQRQSRTKQEFLQAVAAMYGSKLIKSVGFTRDISLVENHLENQTVPVYRDIDKTGKILFHTIVDGIGCTWNNCNFCSHTRCLVSYVPRSASAITDEMAEMAGSGVNFFRFSSSETPPYQGKRIAESILARKLDVRYSMFARPVKITPDIYEAYRLLIRSGLRAVFMGGETGHDLINDRVMNKGVTRKEIVDTISTIRLAANAEGLPCKIGLSLIYPCPVVDGVTLEDVYQANIKLIHETVPDTVIVNPPVPFPDTRWYDNAVQFGFKIHETFAQSFMSYEYSVYKPAELWSDMGYSLQDMTCETILNETGKLRSYAARLGIATDISDEYLMMSDAIGLYTTDDLIKFKKESLLDIMSGTSTYTKMITTKINSSDL